jgi:hypothetical protein
MTTIKISSLFNFTDWNSSVIFKLFNTLSKKKIEYVTPDQADILVIGPYDINSVKKRTTNYFLKRFKRLKLEEKFPNLDIYSFKRNYKPLRIFFSFENFRYDSIRADYYITSDLGISNENHLRFPSWKDYIDWSSENIFRDRNTLNSQRFGSYWNLDDLIKPLGDDFLKRKKEFCIFTSHLVEPRRSIYLKFSKNFKVDGYGPYFNKSIENHNSSDFKTQDILKNYAFNLCPQNSLYPGYYTEGLVNAFVSKVLPITWADKNINLDFNEKSFINLLDYTSSDYEEVCHLIQDQNFLKKFSNEPLLFKKPNLENEKIFIQKILSNF